MEEFLKGEVGYNYIHNIVISLSFLPMTFKKKSPERLRAIPNLFTEYVLEISNYYFFFPWSEESFLIHHDCFGVFINMKEI